MDFSGMNFLEETTLTGASGRAYPFRIFSLKEDFDPTPALYLLGYRHPKGHIAGYNVVPLYLGLAEDLRRELAGHPSAQCLRFELCNCVCLPDESIPPAQWPACCADLARSLDLRCGSDPTSAP
ncbi:hypothetical protein dsx2_2273 [Desulfovibrio sp. X2]|uniref:hypothetical protein n=1 Tax=Desulfovibrio sp. X2 TaxID=941449 RepID=UPI0003586FDB|nr:hypothetical protein [Desulfovibrio sp. X2]EPR43656.1 hypothetical protein dsx2_2273 [Desulfovibrio sp. X2]